MSSPCSGEAKALSVGPVRSDESRQSNETKCCSKCGHAKPLIDFDRNKSKKDGHDSRCKRCVSESKSRSYKKTRKKQRERDKFKSVTIGQPFEAFTSDFARVIGLAIKECQS